MAGMTDFTDPTTSHLRVGTSERDEAVSLLETHARAGRLSADEASERSASARAAKTRGDLGALFADLPASDAHTASSAPLGAVPSDASGHPGSGWRPVLRYVSPPLAVVLFFVTGWVWGFQYSWIWFLIVPVFWGLSYGVNGYDEHRRERRY
jgi:hypothetical protein